jgi:YD repeat-containing protein
MKYRLHVRAFVCANLLATTATASDTTVYTYDALGRLVGTSVAGGPNNGLQTSTSFDPAANRTNYTVTGAPSAIFSIADASVIEGATATVTATRSGSLTGAMTVNYGTANNSAIAPGDYASASGTLTFAAGETSKTISIVTTDDSIYEGNETLGVTLTSPSAGASISRANAVVTVNDNEVVPELSISNASTVEGGVANLTVSLSSAAGSTVTVNYATVAGSANAPGDYGAVSSTLTFMPGETSKTISVATVDDSVYEGAESFTVGLSGPTGGAVIVTGVGTVSLGDNDTPPSFAISSATATEGASIVFTVTKSGASANSHSVNYGTSNGSAIEPGDFGAASGALTFLSNETSKTITVSTVNDTIYESAETFSVYLSGASGGANISTATGTGTINDNDTLPILSVADASVTEGGYASVTVSKSGSTGVNATVSYATSDGTAGAGQYQGTSGTLTLLPGETSKTIQIATTGNGFFNLPKTFNLTLSAPTGATIGTSTGVVTIADDELPPSFTVTTPTARDEGTAIQFSVGLSGNLYYEPPLTINYTTSSGTATSGVDFTPASGTLTFTSPQVTNSVLVQTTQDSVVEPDETIVFTISSPSYGASIITSQSVGTIKNDDIPPSTGPVANTDNAGTFARCDIFTINPLLNDTDPSGNYPLTLVSVATGTGYTRTISGNNVTVEILAAGTKNVQYVVSNSIGGQATGIITWTATSGPVCGGGGGTNVVSPDPDPTTTETDN